MLTIAIGCLPDQAETDLGHGDWVTVDQARIDVFAEATEDRQWIHVDQARAAAGPFGTTIAHGYLTLSLASKFLFDLLVVPDAGSVINYGLDRVRFPAPVPAGARLRGHGRLLGAKALSHGVQTTTRITVECDVTDKPVAVADVLTRFVPAAAT
jgi:acyl dehydratase